MQLERGEGGETSWKGCCGERGWGNIIGKGKHHRKGETSLKGWGNIVHFRIRIGVGGGHATGKGRGWGNVVERVKHHGKGGETSCQGRPFPHISGCATGKGRGWMQDRQSLHGIWHRVGPNTRLEEGCGLWPCVSARGGGGWGVGTTDASVRVVAEALALRRFVRVGICKVGSWCGWWPCMSVRGDVEVSSGRCWGWWLHVAITEVLVMPLRFLPDSSHSCGFRWIPEELILAETSAKITILGVTNSGGMHSFRNWHQNVPRNAQESGLWNIH